MDWAKAKEWEDRFRGKTIGSWTIESLIDHGKSAAVFRAAGEDGLVALKIFDDEIIQRYGDEAQLGRIKRELALVGKQHPSMVRLLGGFAGAPTRLERLTLPSEGGALTV